MKNRLFLSFATGLYCSTFFLSNNWYIYSRNQNIFLLVMGTVICALVILLVAFIILNASKLILKNSNKSIAWDHWMDLMVIGLSLSLSVILLRNTFAAIHLSPAIIIPLLVAIIIVARAKFKNTHLGMLSGTFFF